MSSEAMAEVDDWIRFLSQADLKRTITSSATCWPTPIFSDASNLGGGVVVEGRARYWPLPGVIDQDGVDIGVMEAWALHLALQTAVAMGASGHIVTFYVDNLGVVHGIQKGRSRSRWTNRFLRSISELAVQEGVVISVTYVASAQNLADGPSRGKFEEYQPLSWTWRTRGRSTNGPLRGDERRHGIGGDPSRLDAAQRTDEAPRALTHGELSQRDRLRLLRPCSRRRPVEGQPTAALPSPSSRLRATITPASFYSTPADQATRVRLRLPTAGSSASSNRAARLASRPGLHAPPAPGIQSASATASQSPAPPSSAVAGSMSNVVRATQALEGRDVWPSMAASNMATSLLAEDATRAMAREHVALDLTPAEHLMMAAHGTHDRVAARAHSQIYATTVRLPTRRKYGLAIIAYLRWCDEVGVQMHLRFPIGENVLLAYYAKELNDVRPGMITNRQSALQYWHRVQRIPWAIAPKDTKAIIKAALVCGLPPLEKRRAVLLNDLLAMAKHHDRTKASEVAVFAAALLGFFAMCRPGEFTVRSAAAPHDERVRWADLAARAALREGGPSTFTLRLPSDKTHGKRGFDRVVSEQCLMPEICPVAALHRHQEMNALGPDELGSAHGAMSYRLVEGGRRELTASYFDKTVNGWLAAEGRERVTGHCFRIGGATFYFADSKPLGDIRMRGRWEADTYLVYIRDNYVRHAEMFGDIDPTGLHYD